MADLAAQTIGVLLGIAAAVYVITQVVGWCLQFAPRDPVRIFTADQKRLLMAYARGQCEHRWLVIFRCTARHRLQADHVFPWSRGGRTTIENGQMLCARHNRRKTNRIPGLIYYLRFRHRRSVIVTRHNEPKHLNRA